MNHVKAARKLTKRVLTSFAALSILLVASTATVCAAEKTVAHLDERKLDVAKHITDWMQSKLLAEKVIVAVVSRKGGKDLKSRDMTGMAHSGLAVYDPRAQTWILYQIMNVEHDGEPTAELWRSAPVDFFYGQTGYEENALIMIPDDETQRRIYDSVLSGDAWKLAFTSKYNLLSAYDSATSLNCNKWILMTIAAARTDDFDPDHALRTVRAGFEPARLHFSFWERQVVKKKPNVRRSELPSNGGDIKTVTPQSLYYSGLFKTKIFMASTAMYMNMP